MNKYPSPIIIMLMCAASFTSGILIGKVFSPPTEPVAEVAPTEAPVHSSSSPSSEVVSDKLATFTMRVSAYCPCEICCGPFADGITASGVPAVGRICAADPSIPFGTVLDVEGYGEWVVQDRGGVIKGNRIDLLFPVHGRALLFGVQYLKVRIVE